MSKTDDKNKSKTKEPINNKYSGIPMTEESYKEWEQVFKDMEECFKYLDKQKQ